MHDRSIFVRFIEWAFGDNPDRGHLVVCGIIGLSMAVVILGDRYL